METVLNIARYYHNANSTGTLRLNNPDEYIRDYDAFLKEVEANDSTR